MKTSELLSKIKNVDLDVLHSALTHLRVFGASVVSLDNMKPAERKELEKFFAGATVAKKKSK